ncbi:dermonecrotic toxin LarSicTox-alphaIII1-like isoform X2 [Amblyomma americanum]
MNKFFSRQDATMSGYLLAAYFLLTNMFYAVLSDFTKEPMHPNIAHISSKSASKGRHRRPFYIIGHMVNSLEEVDDFLEKGSNALEADIEFADDGTVLGTFHGTPCDCFRGCFKRETILDFLEHVRDVTSSPDSKFRGKVSLLLLDLKTAKLPQSAKAKAGVTLAKNLWKYLWEGVPPKYRVNVVLSIGYVKDKDVIRGALAYFKHKEKEHILDNIGFDVGMNDPLKRIGLMYKQLGIRRHRWQGDGLSNCVRFLVPIDRLVAAVKARDNKKGFMDKVYHWTVDLPLFIKKSINHGVDGIITNRPDNVLRVVTSAPYRKKLKVADITDSPWTRFSLYPQERRMDRDRESEVLGGGEEKLLPSANS